jgi:hypothetical protein
LFIDASTQTHIKEPKMAHTGMNTCAIRTQHQGIQCLIPKRVEESSADTLDLIPTESVSIQTDNETVVLDIKTVEDEGKEGKEGKEGELV